MVYVTRADVSRGGGEIRVSLSAARAPPDVIRRQSRMVCVLTADVFSGGMELIALITVVCVPTGANSPLECVSPGDA
jgi:hypothetical protein